MKLNWQKTIKIFQKLLKTVSIFTLLSCLSAGYSYSQAFKAKAVLGFNAAQIDGDDLAGFNKLGITGGLGVGYFLQEKLKLSTELLYSQRGSRSSLSIGNPQEVVSIQLDYVELPLILSFHDWYIEDGFYKVKAEAGLSLAYLFNTDSNNSFFDDDLSKFNSTDLSFLAGISYRFSQSIGISARYTRTINTLYNDPTILARALRGYFVTFRLEYYL